MHLFTIRNWINAKHPKQNLTGKQIKMLQTFSQTSRNVMDTRQIRRTFAMRVCHARSAVKFQFFVKNIVKSNSCIYNTLTAYSLQQQQAHRLDLAFVFARLRAASVAFLPPAFLDAAPFLGRCVFCRSHLSTQSGGFAFLRVRLGLFLASA
ncbi:MAG: hypothetical protein LBU53_12915 [Zoogloeaceae bacterium]|nr:hypothetical protein [Zoogloeaceae bacterium]